MSMTRSIACHLSSLRTAIYSHSITPLSNSRRVSRISRDKPPSRNIISNKSNSNTSIFQRKSITTRVLASRISWCQQPLKRLIKLRYMIQQQSSPKIIIRTTRIITSTICSLTQYPHHQTSQTYSSIQIHFMTRKEGSFPIRKSLMKLQRIINWMRRSRRISMTRPMMRQGRVVWMTVCWRSRSRTLMGSTNRCRSVSPCPIRSKYSILLQRRAKRLRKVMNKPWRSKNRNRITLKRYNIKMNSWTRILLQLRLTIKYLRPWGIIIHSTHLRLLRHIQQHTLLINKPSFITICCSLTKTSIRMILKQKRIRSKKQIKPQVLLFRVI